MIRIYILPTYIYVWLMTNLYTYFQQYAYIHAYIHAYFQLAYLFDHPFLLHD
jgi:hypothetical protein